MLGKFLKVLVCLLLAALLVFTCGYIVFQMFDQTEHAIQVVPFQPDR